MESYAVPCSSCFERLFQGGTVAHGGHSVTLAAHRRIRASHQVPLGFEPRGVTIADLFVSGVKHLEDGSQRRVLKALVERVRSLPGVQAVSLASPVPLWGRTGLASVLLPGGTESVATNREFVLFRTSSEDSFATWRIPVEEGRGLERMDRSGSASVVVVSGDG